MNYQLKTILKLPSTTLVQIACWILGVEFVIMLLVGVLINHEEVYWAILDAILLTSIILPVIFFLVKHTLSKQQIQLEYEFNELGIAAVTFESEEGIMVTDTHNRILKVNHAFTNITGYSSEDVRGKTPAILHSGRQDTEYYRQMWITLKRDRYWNGKIWNRRKNGEIYQERLSITAITGDDGKVAHYVGMFSDLSEFRKLDEQLRIAAMTFESMNGVMITDSNIVILRVNKAFTDITGYSEAESVGKTPALLSSGKHHQQFYDVMWKSLNETGVWHGEITNKRKDGSLFNQLLNIAAVRDSDGNVTHYVGSFIDITQSKKLEQESTKLLRRNQILMNTSSEGIHILNIQGELLEANNTFCQMLGYTQDEILHLNVADWETSWTAEELQQRLAGARNMSVAFETAFRRKDGTLINVEVSAHVLNVEGDDYVFAACRDISERKQAERSLRDSKERLNLIFQTLSEGVALNEMIFNDQGEMVDYRILSANPAFYKVIGIPSSNDVTNELASKIYGLDKGSITQFWLTHINSTQATYNEILCPVSSRPVGVLASPFDNNRFVTSFIDISDRMESEKQLRELTAHLQTIREEENTRIAREIHDDLGGKLVTLKIEAYRLSEKLAADSGLSDHLENMVNMVDTAVVATRKIISDLRPTILDDFGLEAALEWQCREFKKHSGIEYSFSFSDSVEIEKCLTESQSINLFRIFQESLSNILKHSNATKAEFGCALIRERNEFTLTIKDNGQGVPKDFVMRKNSYGIRGMRERTAQMGGHMETHSNPGEGFHLKVTVPLPQQHGMEVPE